MLICKAVSLWSHQLSEYSGPSIDSKRHPGPDRQRGKSCTAQTLWLILETAQSVPAPLRTWPACLRQRCCLGCSSSIAEAVETWNAHGVECGEWRGRSRSWGDSNLHQLPWKRLRWFVPIWVHSWMIQAKCPSQNGWTPGVRDLLGMARAGPVALRHAETPWNRLKKEVPRGFFVIFGGLEQVHYRNGRAGYSDFYNARPIGVSWKWKLGRLGIQRMIAFRHYLSAGLMQVTVWSGTQLVVVLGIWVSTRAGQDNSSACVVARWSLSRSESTDSVQVQMRIWLAKLSKLSREKVGANNPNIFTVITVWNNTTTWNDPQPFQKCLFRDLNKEMGMGHNPGTLDVAP